MSQIENKMDDFMPFGGEIRSKYPEDDETVQHAIIDACFAALDDIMFPMDDRGKRPSECQVFFAVQRMYGAEGERDYFLLSDADTIPDEHPFTRDGADWGECGGALACKVLSEPPTLLTFHELAPAGVDTLRDEDGYLFDVPSEAVEKVFGDETLTMPSMLTLLEVELKVDDALAELEAQPDRSNDVDLGSLAMLLSGSDVISTQSVPELLETMADRFGIEPEERTLNANRAQAEECIRTGVPDIQVEIDCTNDDNFIEGTVTVEGESCYFYRPNNSRDTEDYDSVILEPFRPDGFEGDIEEIELPAAIDQNRELAELVVSVATEPYMDPDKAVGREQSIDSLCDEKTEVSESMRYGMEGVGLPMLDASEHLANY